MGRKHVCCAEGSFRCGACWGRMALEGGVCVDNLRLRDISTASYLPPRVNGSFIGTLYICSRDKNSPLALNAAAKP